jgi:NADH-quinone oxidoreductase subunit C
MAKEDEIRNELTAEFPSLRDKIRFQRPRRLWATAENAEFPAILRYLHQKLGFVILATMTGLDKGETLAVIYHLGREDGIILNVEISAPRSNPVIKSITQTFPSADLYERELADLLGIKVEGLAEGFRYPLSDDWPRDQHPLRKDWKPESAPKPAQAKED